MTRLDDLKNLIAVGTDECIEWPFAKNSSGYGGIQIDRRRRKATHVSLELAGCPRPDGAIALHSRDNPPCVNPRHLSWGTPAQNSHEMRHERDRWKGRGRLVDDEMKAVILAEWPEGDRPAQFELAARLGIHRRTAAKHYKRLQSL